MEPSHNSLFFHTDTGTRVPAITADQMSLVDKVAVDASGLNLLQIEKQNIMSALTESPSWKALQDHHQKDIPVKPLPTL